MTSVEVLEIIEYIDNICAEIFATEYQSVQDILAHIGDIERALNDFCEIIPILQEAGIEIDFDTINSQVTQFVNVMERNDAIGIIDSLKYEIRNTLQLYYDILVQVEEG